MKYRFISREIGTRQGSMVVIATCIEDRIVSLYVKKAKVGYMVHITEMLDMIMPNMIGIGSCMLLNKDREILKTLWVQASKGYLNKRPEALKVIRQCKEYSKKGGEFIEIGAANYQTYLEMERLVRNYNGEFRKEGEVYLNTGQGLRRM